MDWVLIAPLLLSFFTTLYVLPSWIKKTQFINLVGKDVNKLDKPIVAEAGGIVVVLGFIIGALSYIAIRTFVFSESNGINTEVFALIGSILILAFIGMIDSLFAASSNHLENQNEWRMGLRKKYRLVLVLFATIPLVVLNVGEHLVNIPFLGSVELGLLYTLIILPVGIIGATFGFNNLAGMNGLEASQGILILSFLSSIAYLNGAAWLAVIGGCMVASLLAFYIFNVFPSKVFPSDVLTYPIGGMIAIMAILGNFERVALFIFILYFVEAGLKIRGYVHLKKFPQSFGIPNKNGGIDLPYKKIYSLTHLSIKLMKKISKDGEARERMVVYAINIAQIVIITLSLLIF